MRLLPFFLIGALTLISTLALPPPAEAQAVELAVPYVSQAPDGAWVTPWNEACEEATVTMINGFYQQKKSITKTAGKQAMQNMIDWEKATFNEHRDTNAEQTAQLIEQFGVFHTRITRSPSLEDIKAELDAQQPVIALVNMYKLYNEPSAGDSYHVFVIIGYDDQKKEFILNDPARSPRRYSYDRVLSALHDYNPVSREADGEATVLFTEDKEPTGIRGIFSTMVEFFKRIFT